MKDVSRVADAFAAQCWPTKTLVVVDPVTFLNPSGIAMDATQMAGPLVMRLINLGLPKVTQLNLFWSICRHSNHLGSKLFRYMFQLSCHEFKFVPVV